MPEYPKIQTVTVLSYSLAAVLAVTSLGGLLLPEAYANETPSWAAQGMGQDFVDLVFVFPLLLLSAYQTQKGQKVFRFLLGGTLVYLVYSYVLYGFCMHFNRLFFLYCAGLGLSVYALVLYGAEFQTTKVEAWFNQKKSTQLPASYFLVTTLVFYFLWLSEDVPALLSGTAPKSLAVAGLITNPIHVLDLSIVLPAMALASFQLLRKKPFGYFFFPVMMVFSIIMGAAIGGMTVAMKLKGVTGDLTVAYVFGVGILFNSAVLGLFLRGMK
jgi:hypothetical protein